MTRARLRHTGSLARLGAESRRELITRTAPDAEEIELVVSSVIAAVRRDGDAALVALARELDGVANLVIEVPAAARRRALDRLDPPLRAAMEASISSLVTAHRAVLPVATAVETSPGVVVGRRPDPLDRIGVYAPGGRAPYPSSVLMGAVPARVAGVREVVLCSPPDRSGRVPGIVLAAAELAGVDRVFALGGAGAVAAMAFGTATVPRVDRIVGPGGVHVTEAKAQVARVTGIDMLAGPSELLVIADAAADLAGVAREMLAQAEHDPRSTVVALVVGDGAPELEDHLARLVSAYGRKAIIRDALATRGAVLRVESLADALDFATEFAPEHLLLAVDAPEDALPSVRNAGAVFLGQASSVSFGDYGTGANHVLPTGGLARSTSALSTGHFMRWTTWQRVSPDAARRLAPDVARLAEAESLGGHALAAAAWEGTR